LLLGDFLPDFFDLLFLIIQCLKFSDNSLPKGIRNGLTRFKRAYFFLK